MDAALSDREFEDFRRFIHDKAGISLAESKKALVCGRLAKRLAQRGLSSYAEYYQLISTGHDATEMQMAVDLLTTNETYFFREPQHFDLMAKTILPSASLSQPFRVWSAACSSGEEVYTLAMVLAEARGIAGNWELCGSDISTRVLERARRGQYPMDRAKLMPGGHLKRYCLKGMGEQAGTLLVQKALRERIQWFQANLNAPMEDRGPFDVIFLRNVMIYFDPPTKQAVMRRLVPMLRRGGWFFVSHSENLHGITDALVQYRPSVFRRP